MVQAATPDAAFRTNTFQNDTCTSQVDQWRGVGNSFEKYIIKPGQFVDHLSVYGEIDGLLTPKICASFPLVSFPTLSCRVSLPVSQQNPELNCLTQNRTE